MSRENDATASPRSSTCGEMALWDFVNNDLTPKQLKQQADLLLDSEELLQSVQGLTPEDQMRFIDRVDQVCQGWLTLLSQCLPLIFLMKLYPTINLPTVNFINTLGGLCSATEWLPTSTLLAAGLEKHGSVPVASGGLTDIWQGEYHGSQAAIKAFRIYPTQNWKETKEVGVQLTLGVH